MVLNINTDEGINSYFTGNVFHWLPETPLGVKEEWGEKDRSAGAAAEFRFWL